MRSTGIWPGMKRKLNAVEVTPRGVMVRNWSATRVLSDAATEVGCSRFAAGAVVVAVVQFGTLTRHAQYRPGLRCAVRAAVCDGVPGAAIVTAAEPARTHCDPGCAGGLCR